MESLKSSASLINKPTGWIDPTEKIWGFHVHQEVPQTSFGKALIVQTKTAEYLKSHGVKISNDDAFRPGYGPHLEHMWELRVEEKNPQILEQMGQAICFLAVNRFGLSGYIHPLMHRKEAEDDLATEGKLNQGNILWFSHDVAQKKDFFFNPPRTSEGKIVDTRSPSVLNGSEKEVFYAQGLKELEAFDFRNPDSVILNGFYLNVDFGEGEQALAQKVSSGLMAYLREKGIPPPSCCQFESSKKEKYFRWQVRFTIPCKSIFRTVGLSLSWLMCNRQGLSVSVQPVTWQEGDSSEELRARQQYCMFMGVLPPSHLDLIRIQIEEEREQKR